MAFEAFESSLKTLEMLNGLASTLFRARPVILYTFISRFSPNSHGFLTITPTRLFTPAGSLQFPFFLSEFFFT